MQNKKADTYFIWFNFYVVKSSFGYNIKVVLSSNKEDVLKFLESDFELNISDKNLYIKAYQDNGFISCDDFLASWEVSTLIESDFLSVLNKVKKKIEKISVGEHLDLELISKLGLFFAYYEYCQDFHEYNIYATYNMAFNSNSIIFDVRIENYIVYYSNSNEFKVVFKCVAIGESVVIDFDIIAYSPHGFIKDEIFSKSTRNPHIISNKLDIDRLSKFIIKTIMYLKASSNEELLLKIGTFSNSVFIEDLLLKRMSEGNTFKYN